MPPRNIPRPRRQKQKQGVSKEVLFARIGEEIHEINNRDNVVPFPVRPAPNLVERIYYKLQWVLVMRIYSHKDYERIDWKSQL